MVSIGNSIIKLQCINLNGHCNYFYSVRLTIVSFKSILLKKFFLDILMRFLCFREYLKKHQILSHQNYLFLRGEFDTST